jgi:hypothetical protein
MAFPIGIGRDWGGPINTPPTAHVKMPAITTVNPRLRPTCRFARMTGAIGLAGGASSSAREAGARRCPSERKRCSSMYRFAASAQASRAASAALLNPRPSSAELVAAVAAISTNLGSRPRLVVTQPTQFRYNSSRSLTEGSVEHNSTRSQSQTGLNLGVNSRSAGLGCRGRSRRRRTGRRGSFIVLAPGGIRRYVAARGRLKYERDGPKRSLAAHANRALLHFATVRPWVQIPGPRPKIRIQRISSRQSAGLAPA